MYRYALKAAVLGPALMFITAGSALMFITAGSAPAADEDHISFKMVVSKGTSSCLPEAGAKVQIISDGQAEDMFIVATGLPPTPLSTFS